MAMDKKQKIQRLERLAGNLQTLHGATGRRIIGPAGLANRYWLELETADRTEGIPLEWNRGWCVRDFSVEPSGEFPAGSIGARNGMNYPLRRKPISAEDHWYLQFLTEEED